jgi:hypothetical protein
MRNHSFPVIVSVSLFLAIAELPGLGEIYYGNQDASRGGTVGQGSVSFTKHGRDVTVDFTKGPLAFADNLVFFIDSQAGGFNGTATFSDNSVGLTRSISGLSENGLGRSTVTFVGGFFADFALAFGVNSGAAIYRLDSGGQGSLERVRSLSLNPSDSQGYAAYSLTFNLDDLGVAANQDYFRFESIYATDGGGRYLESFNELDPSSTKNFGNILFATDAGFGTAPVPEPSAAALAVCGALVFIGSRSHRRPRRA